MPRKREKEPKLTQTPITLEDIPKIGPATAKKLRKAGFYTVYAIAAAPARELADTGGLSEDRAREISVEARSLLNLTFHTGRDLYEYRKHLVPLTTGCPSLDDLLDGGIHPKFVIELIGQFASGKTQICHAACVFVQNPYHLNGLEGKAVFIDTEGTFSPERIHEIATNRGFDPLSILENIIVIRVYNSDHQILIVEQLDQIMLEQNIKLIVVDSVISHFRSEFVGRESLPMRQQRLNQHLHRLLRMAEMYTIPVIITNQVVSSPDAFFGPPSKPAGGHILAHFSTNRLFLRRGRKHMRIARVIDSPYLPEGEALFRITENGVVNVED